MKKMQFELIEKNGSSTEITAVFHHACLFGWAGRNKEEVKKHAIELEEHGIRGPKNMPEHFLISPTMMGQQEEIQCIGDKTCGEIEFFFFLHEGDILVGVGSEHTDRALEAVDMIKSKAVCEKVMSRQVWRYSDIVDHWDEIQLKAWQTSDGKEAVYQDSPLEALLTLEDLKEEALKLYDDLNEKIIWSGTIPTVEGLVYGESFRGEMVDKQLGRALNFEYRIVTLPADL